MRKISFVISVILLFLVNNACKKSTSSSSSAKTVQNLSGSYSFTAISLDVLGSTIDIYDTLPACQKDNIIQLNTNMTAQFVDAGVVCAPPSDSTGTWSLSQNTDTIYVSNTAFFIKSWDGKTLMLTSSESVGGFPATANSTLVKK